MAFTRAGIGLTIDEMDRLVDQKGASLFGPCSPPFVGIIIFVGPEAVKLEIHGEYRTKGVFRNQFFYQLIYLVETVLENRCKNKITVFSVCFEHAVKSLF